MEEEAKKNKPSESPLAQAKAYLSELRMESSAAAICFSDSCPCCGNKKRRCLYPSSTSRKKLLVFDLPSPSPPPPAASSDFSLSLTSSSLPRSDLFPPSISSGPISPSSDTITEISPLPPAHGSFRRRLSDPTSPPPPSPTDHHLLERSNSSTTPASAKAVICSAEEDKGRVQEEEVRVGLKCRCGTVREIVLIR